MGVLSDLIIADESDAAAINQARGKHSERWPTLESKGIDTIKLAALASIVVGDQGGSANVSILDQPSPQGPWVILVRRDLVKALADLPPTMHEAVAEKWATGEEFQVDGWHPVEVRDYLDELIAHCQKTQAAGKDLLLWMCL